MKRSELFFALILLPIDVAMIIASFVASYYLRSHIEFGQTFSAIGLRPYLVTALYLIPVWLIIFALSGLYAIRNNSGFYYLLYKIFVSTLLAMLFFVVILFFSKSLFFSRAILVFIWIISLVLISIGRTIVQILQRYFIRHGLGVRHLLLAGDGIGGDQVRDFIKSNPQIGYSLAGYVSDGDRDDNKTDYLGQLGDIDVIIKKYNIDETILVENLPIDKKIKIMQICDDLKVTFKYVPDISALLTSNFIPGLLGNIPVMETKSLPLDGWGRILKRLVDIVFSLLLLIILSPIFLLIAIAIKLTSRGPVFYRQDRIGRDEEKFTFYKFRSMYVRKKLDTGDHWTTKEEEKRNVTLSGAFLRKTNLDELPQLFNIFAGDMSFVGPRPEQPKLVEKFEDKIPDYFRRHKVKTGLTGWAQVNGLKGDTSIKERVKYDIYYIENWSLWFDAKIIIKTIGLIINEALAGKSEYRSGS